MWISENIFYTQYGLYACKIKSKDVQATFDYMKKKGADFLSDICKTPEGKKHFFVQDPNGNIFEIVEGLSWYINTGFEGKTGGVAGSVIGVSDINRSLDLYQNVLGYTTVVYDVTESFPVYHNLPGGKGMFRRVLLRHPEARKGPFAQMLGASEIELVQSIDRMDCRKIFENRFWGDWGFIHLCFDVQGMNALKKDCEAAGYPFAIDTGDTFDMGEAGGRFSYIEDADGTRHWYLNGKRHRENGPALEWADGTGSWYLNDKLHREGGPALEGTDGSRYWYLNGDLHREDGPAVEGADGTRKWYLNGKLQREEVSVKGESVN